jgi:hypothetical protein
LRIRIVSPNGSVWGTTGPTNVNELLNGEGLVLDVYPKLKPGTKKAGQLKVIRAEIFKRPSFSDYLRSGWQL